MLARAARAAALIVCTTLTMPAAMAQGIEQSYEDRLLRLAEILGAIHHLRDICGADEGQLWREQMLALLEAEEPPGQFRARLIAAFNNGYRGFQRTYSTCTTSAKRAADKFFTEGSQIATSMTATLESQTPEVTDEPEADEPEANAPGETEEGSATPAQ